MIGAEGISIGNAANCSSGLWSWNGISFRSPATPRLSIAIAGGTLTGSDAGEWGGTLTWTAPSGGAVEVYDDNIHGMEPVGDSVLVAAGLAHLSLDNGAILLVSPVASPRVTTLVVLPGAPDSLAAVIPNQTFVAWSHGYAIVFDLSGIKGVAPCVC
ncbi:MAG TPA: hypothetical protein VEA80_01770 [Vitreimonas sp.]|nr:hypothetical protein [Vitreimonas sp.]